MGNYAIIIEGVGAHHNSDPHDADQLAAEIADRLRAYGHNVTAASFVYGGKQDMLSTVSRLPPRK